MYILNNIHAYRDMFHKPDEIAVLGDFHILQYILPQANEMILDHIKLDIYQTKFCAICEVLTCKVGYIVMTMPPK